VVKRLANLSRLRMAAMGAPARRVLAFDRRGTTRTDPPVGTLKGYAAGATQAAGTCRRGYACRLPWRPVLVRARMVRAVGLGRQGGGWAAS